MSDYHEPVEALPPEVRDLHRALTSLKEEIEAIDWYHQRVAACADADLRYVLSHNRDEEIEHACLTLEWLRRNMTGWDRRLREYLFTDQPLRELERRIDGEGAKPPPKGEANQPRAGSQGMLAIGSLKGA